MGGDMVWHVRLSRKMEKKSKALPQVVQELLFQLMREIAILGPVRGNWPNYSKLGANRHHCHLKKGKPCYVAVWEERDKQIRLVEVIYAGTHEKAPY